MPNWAYTSYAIEGPHETLQKIEQAILHHDIQENSSEYWEGNTLHALGITWDKRPDGNTYRLRGFINEKPWWDGNALKFYAEEAWGLTDFSELLKNHFPDIKVYWVVEESGMGLYGTNDKEGKYFPEMSYVDTCSDGNYDAEYFTYKSDAFKWLHDLTNGRVNSEETLQKFNDEYEESQNDLDNFILLHEFRVVDDD